jgi:Tfp pilus assembly protein PilX
MINKKPNLDRPFIQFLLRAQQFAQEDPRSEKGYAMLIVSMITLSMFSLLAAYMTMANLSKSSTDAYIDGTNTFYAAESGLNRRADQLRQKFIGYATPTGPGTYTAASLLSTCLPVSVSAAIDPANDFECRNYSFAYNNNIAQVTSGGNTVLSERDGGQNRINYTAYTFVKPELDYATTPPAISAIPAGETFAGLNASVYKYTVYATAAKPDPNSPTSTVQQTGGQTVLQMNFRSTLIPLFQFAAFYGGDLEILPGQDMTLSGPVHSNGSLYLGGGTRLTIAGNVTSVGSIYSKRKNDNSTYADGIVRITTSGTGVTPVVNTSLLAANGNAPTTAALSPANLTATFGTRVRSGIGTLTVPPPGFLGKVDAGQPDGIGSYYGRADLRIQYQPSNAVPLTVTAIKTGVSGADSTTCAASLYISAKRNERNQLVCSTLNNDQLRSLRQPVLVRAANANERGLAPAGQTFNPTPTPADITNAIALQRVIVKYGGLNFDRITTVLTPATLPGATAAELAPFTTTPRQIANKAGYFYLPPPIQIYPGFINNRERVASVRTNIQMVQTNIRSLAFWNRDNVVVDAANTDTSQDEVLFRRLQNPLAAGSKYATVCNGVAADPRNQSLQCLGLAASDTSEGGLVLHATVDTTQAPVYAAGRSPYGFAFVGGSNLPGALTIASDQAVYLQGDYNYFDRTNTPNTNSTVVTNLFKISNDVPASSGLKEPASILADSLNILSNQCNLSTSTTDRLTCGINTDAAVAATTTSMNVAFLAGTDVTTPGVYNGGLENYPRLHENWGGQTLNYRGSFISLGTPLNVSGRWADQVYGAPNRNWNYDIAFSSASNLPPLTPRLVSLRQDVFRRTY